jgi:hypothetical protein
VTPQTVKDLFMLQWTLNSFLESGSDQVRRSDIRIWCDPESPVVSEAFRDWEAKGFVSILADLRTSKEKDVCLRLLRRIEAIPEPPDLNRDA